MPYLSHIVYNLKVFTIFVFCTEWTLVAERQICRASDLFTGWFNSIAGCAESCIGKSFSFFYGRKDGAYCGSKVCECFCKSQLGSNDQCQKSGSPKAHFNLYLMFQQKVGKAYCSF